MKDSVTLARLKEMHRLIKQLKNDSQEEFNRLHDLELIVALWIESLQPKRKKK